MKIPETWYLLLLALCLVGYTWACFQFLNDPYHKLATFFFGCAVFTALIGRFLLERWQQKQLLAGFTQTSFAFSYSACCLLLMLAWAMPTCASCRLLVYR